MRSRPTTIGSGRPLPLIFRPTSCAGTMSAWPWCWRPRGPSIPRSSPITIAVPATPPAPATIIRGGPTRPPRHWPSTTRRSSIGPPSSCTRGRRPGRAPLAETGRCARQCRPGSRRGPSLLEGRRVSHGGRDPGAEAAGFHRAPDQRACRRRAGPFANACWARSA